MIWFTSDLHLSPQSPGATACFLAFLQQASQQADALYILGDFVEVWIGDEACDDPWYATIIDALHQATEAGLEIGLIHGNRDFLLGPAFAARSGVTLLPDPYVLSLPAWQFVLSHGDALCTDDTAYQAFRTQVRNPDWQAAFLAKPVAERWAIARQIRAQSEANKQTAYLTDLNPGETEDFLRQYGYATFIHGHTHQPATHDHIVDGIHVERWVLADWSETQGDYLAWHWDEANDRSQLTRHCFSCTPATA